jgi:hypothetical protein
MIVLSARVSGDPARSRSYCTRRLDEPLTQHDDDAAHNLGDA